MDIRQLILPAGIGLTHIKVYTEAGPDGLIGGGPHMHMVCSEIYFVLAGTGYIELMNFQGLEQVELQPNKTVFFRPGVIHRVVNPNRDLQILAIMQNGGLPERGDFVLTFPQEVLGSPTAYAQAARVASHEDAVRRRDLAVQGFMRLREAMAAGQDKGQEALRAFYRAASRLMAPKVDGFEWVLKSAAQAEVKDSMDACDFLRIGRTDYLEHARHAAIYPLDQPTRSGMCGELHAYALDETFLVDGTTTSA